MHFSLRIFIFLMLATLPGLLPAQNITGTWEGIMSDELIQINIEQRDTRLCGYTYDYVLNDKSNHCRAKFEGYYDPAKKIWYLSGTQFIENSGSHVLMRIKLWQEEGDINSRLVGTVSLKSFFSNLFDAGGDDFELRKVSKKPLPLPARIPPCFPPPPQKAEIIKPRPKPNVPGVKPVVPKTPVITPTQKDSVKTLPVVVPSLVLKGTDSIQLNNKMNARKRVEQSHLIIDVDRINLKVYDNGIVDNDTVSIFYNGRLVIGHQRLSEKPIELNIVLDKGTAIHEITLYADNTGSIPPNTALVIVTAGNQRYELHSKANLEENAVLVFEYRKNE